LKTQYDAIVVGSGPNGLAAAITLAKARLSVLLVEGRKEPGGGVRSEELTLPGFIHDTCSAIHPLALASPFFQSLDLEALGLEWIQPDLPLAHPLDHGAAACLHRSLDLSAQGFGPDQDRYQSSMKLFVPNSGLLIAEILQPIPHWPGHPGLLLEFGILALQSAQRYSCRYFEQPATRALFAGMAAHSFLSLRQPASAATGLVLNILAHSVGWPLPRGGSGKIAEALSRRFQALGGTIQTNCLVTNIDELPKARAILFDVSPRQLLSIAGHHFPKRYRDALARYQYGPGVFKADYALSSPIPWSNPDCHKAGTIHVGGTLDEIMASEEDVTQGIHPQKPFVLVAQPSRFDSSRAPAGKHTAWAYCHVPPGSTFDMAERMENQIERFAPGFRDCVLKRTTRTCRDLESFNPNLVGGDINGGRANLKQLVIRPILSSNPYRTPFKGVYLCSASTPPGGGVHGMCGFNAARHALRAIFKI
jgi:phytoene dehydrogenase-like protein